MKVLVVYESFFGNTEKVARAIAAAYLNPAEIEVVAAAHLTAEQTAEAEVLVVGSPTRAFSATEATKKWLKTLKPSSLQGKKVAAFDTRMDVKEVNNGFLTFMAGIFGYAAEPIDKALVRAGGEQLVKPEGFIVTASEGPLREGELERAAVWAQGLFAKI
jgi:flavodoxin